MAAFGVRNGTKALDGQPPEVTGAQGFGTPAAQQNAIVQGLGGSSSSPSVDAKGQSPADKLLSYATSFGGSYGPPMPMETGAPASEIGLPGNEEITKQLFPPPTPADVGGVGGPMPWSAGAPSVGILPGETPGASNEELAQQLFGSEPLPPTPVVPGPVPDSPPAPSPMPWSTPNSGVGVLPGETPAVAPAAPPPVTPPADLRTRPSAPPPAIPPAPAFTDQQLADVYASGQPFTPEQQAILDQRNPKPQGTEDPNIAAQWYRGFAFLNPLFANITSTDVTNHRELATAGVFASMGHPEFQDFGRWFVATQGHYSAPGTNGGLFGNGPVTPGEPTAPPTATAPPPTISPAPPPPVAPPTQPPAPVPEPPAATAPAPAPPAAAGPPATVPPAANTPPPLFPDPLGPPPDLPPIAMPDVSNDPWTQMLQRALGAQKDVADAQIRRSVTAAQAATGGLNQGGFGSAIAAPIADYNAQLDKEGATQLSAAHNSAMDRALQGSIAERQSQTQLQLGRMDVMSKKYSADQALEGEKFRAQIDQAISAAQNTSAEKISAAVNAKDLATARIAADSAGQVAALNAQAASAAAGASASAQRYASDMAYQGTIAKIAQDREQAQLQYNLGITGIGNDTYKANLANQQFMLNLLKDMGPEQLAKYLFPNQQLPTPVYVQP